MPNEASAFLVMLDMAGTAAVDDWSKGAAGNEGLEGAQPRGPLHVGSLVEAHERQLRPRAPLLRVETAQMGGEGEERGVGGSTPVVRLDVVGLLDLAASIRLADELALMM